MVAASSSPTPNSDSWLQFDPQHAAGVARIVAAARLLFVSGGWIAVVLDPPVYLPFGSLLVTVLAWTAAGSAGVLVAAHVVPLAVVRWGVLLHVWDLAWIVVVLVLSDGANSVFFLYFAFAVLASAFQWRFAVTLATGAAAVGVVLTAALAHHLWDFGTHVHLNTVVVRTTSAVLATLLIALLTEKDWRQRLRSVAAARITSGVTAEAGFVKSVRAVLEAVLADSGAPCAVLALQEENSPHVFLWRVRRRGERLDVKLDELPRTACETYLFGLPPAIGALRIRKTRAGRQMLALDGSGLVTRCPAVPPDALTATPFDWSTVLCLPDVSGHGWTGRLFVFDPGEGKRGRSHLRFLRAVVAQVSPALFNVYLQRRIESRSGRGERAILARAMHDGALQALIGAELELELLRRERGSELSAPARERLDTVRRLLDEQVLEFRDIIQKLKHLDLQPERFLDHLDELVRRFRDGTGIDARLLCDVEAVDLPARTCREVASVVREALVNVRKHAQASRVVVQVASAGGGWRIDISDNGRGFGFEGRLAGDQLEARHRGPALIRDRVKDLGGHLLLESRPGRGSRLEITIPARAS